MKNFLSNWFKRSSGESFPEVRPMSSQALISECGSDLEDEDTLNSSAPSFGGDRNAMPLDLIEERGEEYDGSRAGEFQRKKMDESLYRALSG